MRRTLAILLLTLLAGCAVSPAEMREAGQRSDFTLKGTPAQAAECGARGIENAANSWAAHQPTVRDGDTPGSKQLTILGLLVVDYQPDGTGSKATLWELTHVLQSIRDRYRQAIAAC